MPDPLGIWKGNMMFAEVVFTEFGRAVLAEDLEAYDLSPGQCFSRWTRTYWRAILEPERVA